MAGQEALVILRNTVIDALVIFAMKWFMTGIFGVDSGLWLAPQWATYVASAFFAVLISNLLLNRADKKWL